VNQHHEAPLFGYQHRDQYLRNASVIDQYVDRYPHLELRDEFIKCECYGAFFKGLAAGANLDAPRPPVGGFVKSIIFDCVVRA